MVAWTDHADKPEPPVMELNPTSEEETSFQAETPSDTSEAERNISPMMKEVMERLNVPVDRYESLGDVIDGFDEMSEPEKAKTLEEAIQQANQYSPENLLGATGFIKDRLGIETRKYEPTVEVEYFESTARLVPFCRIIEIDGDEYFQQLAVDPEGNYVITKSIPTGEMTDEDKRNLQIFNLTNTSPALKEMRNISLDLINNILDSQDKAKRHQKIN